MKFLRAAFGSIRCEEVLKDGATVTKAFVTSHDADSKTIGTGLEIENIVQD